jgi:hypothetical protein
MWTTPAPAAMNIKPHIRPTWKQGALTILCDGVKRLQLIERLRCEVCAVWPHYRSTYRINTDPAEVGGVPQRCEQRACQKGFTINGLPRAVIKVQNESEISKGGIHCSGRCCSARCQSAMSSSRYNADGSFVTAVDSVKVGRRMVVDVCIDPYEPVGISFIKATLRQRQDHPGGRSIPLQPGLG